MSPLLKLVLALLLSFSAGAVGSVATFRAIPTWYAKLKKPRFNPPNWLFGPAWTVLYILIGISLYLVWTTPLAEPPVLAFTAFGIQLLLNAVWSLVFFGRRRIGEALVIIVLLWIMIGVCIVLFWSISVTAALLLVPYLAWVTFATTLNAAIWKLNS